MIWYPYAASEEFPELGLGGRSAMVGAFYEFNKNASSPNKFPDYYDEALFVFDWMRNWVMALRFDDKENYLRSEPFMAANGDFRRPIDLAFGSDGIMYMLEYGSVYGADNDDARLVKIEYNTGNRAPVAQASITDSVAEARVDKTVFLTSERRTFPILREANGQVPLRISFSSRGSRDLDDDDKITYQWLFDGKTVGAITPTATYTYRKPGTYKAILQVKDKAGLLGRDTVMVYVGNTKPSVTIASPANKSFFWAGKSFPYVVKVKDWEDASVDPKQVKVFYSYNPQPGTQENPSLKSPLAAFQEPTPLGKTLMNNSDCKACHTVDKVSVGPSLLAIAQRYKGQAGALEKLATKIINGGGGNWSSDHMMSAHPQLSTQDAQEMVRYIYSLTDPKKTMAAMPMQGILSLKGHPNDDFKGRYTLLASYKDKGGNQVGPLTGTDVVTLRNATVKTAYADAHVGFARFRDNLSPGAHKSYILLKAVDLTNIKGFTYEYAAANQTGEIEVRIDSQAGPIVSRTTYGSTDNWDALKKLSGQLTKPVSGRHDIYFFAIKRTKPNDEILKLTSITFDE
jgi:cytochrome c